jgi:hypothetical protein
MFVAQTISASQEPWSCRARSAFERHNPGVRRTLGESNWNHGASSALFIVAILGEHTEADVNVAKAGLMKLGLDRLHLITSQPPKLSVALAPDVDEQRIEEVTAFLGGVQQVDAVRMSNAGWQKGPLEERPVPGVLGTALTQLSP